MATARSSPPQPGISERDIDAPDRQESALTAPPPVSQSAPAVLFEQVGKTFGKQEVLNDITFQVPWGKILGVIGPSGSGKTTTIRIMLGMLKPTSGTVRLFGRDPWRLRRSDRERLGYLPQDFVLYPALTTEENLRFAASLYGMPWWEMDKRIAQLLEYVELTPARKQRAEELSGGMRRRLSLAATLMHDPDFLVLDEPTAGIDPILRTSIWDGLRGARDEGKTMVVTTQYVTEAEYCDQVLLIFEGRLIASGTPAELRHAATGGDILDVRFEQPLPDITERLQSLPFVHHVEPLEQPNEVRVVVTDMGADLPALTEYCNGMEGGGVSIEPHMPTFDDVFVRLVERARDGEQDETHGDSHDPAPTPVAA